MNTNFTKSTIQPPCAFFCKSSKIVKAFYKICAVPNVSCSRKRGKLSNSCFFPKSLIDNQATDCVTLSPFKHLVLVPCSFVLDMGHPIDSARRIPPWWALLISEGISVCLLSQINYQLGNLNFGFTRTWNPTKISSDLISGKRLNALSWTKNV